MTSSKGNSLLSFTITGIHKQSIALLILHDVKPEGNKQNFEEYISRNARHGFFSNVDSSCAMTSSSFSSAWKIRSLTFSCCEDRYQKESFNLKVS